MRAMPCTHSPDRRDFVAKAPSGWRLYCCKSFNLNLTNAFSSADLTSRDGPAYSVSSVGPFRLLHPETAQHSRDANWARGRESREWSIAGAGLEIEPGLDRC